MKRSFSSCSFGLSQDIPFTSPTLTTSFLACHSTDSNLSFSANHQQQQFVYNSLAPLHHEGRAGGEPISEDERRAPIGDSIAELPKEHEDHNEHNQLVRDSNNDYNGLDFNAATDAQLHHLQTDWNYQDACNNYQTSLGMQHHQMQLMGNYCPNFFGDMSLIHSSDAAAYQGDTIQPPPHPYVDMSAIHLYSGVSPGSYLSDAPFVVDGSGNNIAPAAESCQSNSPLDLDMIEYELGIRQSTHFHNHQYHQPAPMINDMNAPMGSNTNNLYEKDLEKKKKKKAPSTASSPAVAARASAKVVKKVTKQSSKPSKHVGKACTHCKKAHLACDNARPCKRCVHMGKDDCVDVEHKRRGRPRSSPEKQHTHFHGQSPAAAGLVSIAGAINPLDPVDMPAEAA